MDEARALALDEDVPAYDRSKARGEMEIAGWARLTGTRPLFTPEALHALRRHRHVSHRKAADELGYHPRPIEETVGDTITWFREKGMLKQ